MPYNSHRSPSWTSNSYSRSKQYHQLSWPALTFAMLAFLVGFFCGLIVESRNRVTANVPLKFPTKGCVAVLTNEVPKGANPGELIWNYRCTISR